MFRRFNQACLYFAIGIGIASLVLGYIYASIAISWWLFGNILWGFIPIGLIIAVISTYPMASRDYLNEIEMQEKISKSLKKDWTHGFKN